MTQGVFSSSKFNSQQNRNQISKGGSSFITRGNSNASGMNWNVENVTAWDAATLGGNPLSPEFYMPGFKWGNGATDLGNYVGYGFSVNRYVSMADFSTGGTYTGRYDGAGSGITSDFNYRYNMNGENGYSYGRDT